VFRTTDSLDNSDGPSFARTPDGRPSGVPGLTATQSLGCALVLAPLLALPGVAVAATAGNPLCPGEEVSFNPGNGQDIVVPEGCTVSVFVSGLNFPTGIAFRGNPRRFEVYVLESGRFPTSRCNDGVAWQARIH
jgi:hypothetical protein